MIKIIKKLKERIKEYRKRREIKRKRNITKPFTDNTKNPIKKLIYAKKRKKYLKMKEDITKRDIRNSYIRITLYLKKILNDEKLIKDFAESLKEIYKKTEDKRYLSLNIDLLEDYLHSRANNGEIHKNRLKNTVKLISKALKELDIDNAMAFVLLLKKLYGANGDPESEIMEKIIEKGKEKDITPLYQKITHRPIRYALINKWLND